MKPLTILFSVCCTLLFTNLNLSAQKSAGDVGIGVQFGQPTGVTLQIYNPGTSVDFLAAWNLDDFFFLNMHLLFDAAITDNRTVNFFYGPGAYVGIRDRDPLDDDVVVGLSGSFGLDVMIRKFQIFIQGTPRLSLVNSSDFDMGGGVGFRIYL